MGLRDPDDAKAYDELLSQITVGGPQPPAEPIRICEKTDVVSAIMARAELGGSR